MKLKPKQTTWESVVHECEQVLGTEDSASSPSLSNLPNLVRDMKVELERWRQDYKQMSKIMTTHRKRKFESHSIDAVVTLIEDNDELKRRIRAMESTYYNRK